MRYSRWDTSTGKIEGKAVEIHVVTSIYLGIWWNSLHVTATALELGVD